MVILPQRFHEIHCFGRRLALLLQSGGEGSVIAW